MASNAPSPDQGNGFRILGVSQNTLRTWAEDGRVPMFGSPANGYRMFRRDDLEEFLREAAKPVKPARVKKAK